MDIGLGVYASREVDSSIMNEFSNELKNHFVDFNFGTGIFDISIGIICVSKDYEPFFIPRKPKYTKKKKENEIDGIKFVLEKSLEFDCKIDFNEYQKSNDLDRKKLIAQGILDTSKEVFENKKVKDFDSKAFISDLISFFQSQGYLEIQE